MPGWRGRRLGCRRREVAIMTSLTCLSLLSLYSLALTWCIALPQGQPGGLGAGLGAGRGAAPSDQDPSPFIAARKLQFDPARRRLSSNDNKASSLLFSSSSSSRHRKDSGGGDGGVQHHHRMLQFSRNGKDGGFYVPSDNTLESGRNNAGVNHNGVRTMQQHPPSSSSSSKDSPSPSAIYLEEGSEEGEGGWGSPPGQEYRDGPGLERTNNNDNTSSSGTRRLPGAIIIGVKKAGTRALLEFLRIHPDVQAPGPEPHFFDRNYNRGLKWYRSLMPATEEGQLTMEKTPSYFITREVPKRLRSMSRDVKLLVVVRDPVTRAISDYVQAASKRDGKMKRFEDMALLDHRLGIVNTSWGAVRIGVYSKHLERWFKYFPRKQLHFVSGEQLIANPAQVMKDVQQFLGLSQFITDKHFYLNATRGFPCLVKDPDNNSKPHCLGKTKGRRHPDVDPKVIERLRGFYRPFNAKFYQMVGRDFGWS